ncbi:hypothetical protein BDF22DRAFT_694085 [Syncephalis plumigaleata]|nr:hypothetical protein BDF22DRAFT_694085 [Syncephalis plumigaleata]
MPINYSNGELEAGWERNATRLFGIPLHPLGEMDMPSFMEKNVKANDPHHPIAGIERQFFIIIVVGWLFATNMRIAFWMILRLPHNITGWLCMIPPFFGITWVLCGIITLLYDFTNCRIVVWYLAISLTVSTISNSAIILQKAYLVLFRQQWILIVGIIFIIPQLTIFIFTWRFCPVISHVDYGCTFYYPPYLPWIWVGVEAPSYIMFSSIFSYVAYKQYKLFGSDVWRRLARDGILVMCSAILCKLVCGTIVIFNLFDAFSEMFVIIDW